MGTSRMGFFIRQVHTIYLHVLLISSLVDAHDEHGGVGGGGGDDDLLGATGVMGACLD